MMLEIGSQAPEFTLPDQNGEPVSLSDFRGQTVVLYFYPKDSTPGCTRQACALPTSTRNCEHWARWCWGKPGLIGFPPAVHPEKRPAPSAFSPTRSGPPWRAHGVWQEKKLYGKVSMGIVRTTYLIDGAGIIRAVMPKVSRIRTRRMCWPCSGPGEEAAQ